MEDVPNAPLADPRRAPLVGRGPELAELRHRFDVAAGGDPQVVVIGGEAGIGKSRLVAELAEQVSGTARVVVGHCMELGPDGPPYAPFVAVLRTLVADLGADRVAELAGPGRTDLAWLVPELGPVAEPDPMGRGRLFEAMATLVERGCADRPLVLVVEDLHWSDSSTRDLLRFLMRTIGGARVLVLLTYRRDELPRSHPLLGWLAEVDRLPHAHRIGLDRLGDDDVDLLVRRLAGTVPARSVARIRTRSQGVPFFIEELAACAEQDSPVMPETLRDLMLARLDRLAPSTREVLRIASASGTVVDHAVLRALVGPDEAALDACLREAVGGQVLVVDTAREAYAFRHALMREAVHDDLLPGEHARLHARYAEAMEKLGRDDQAGEIAHHWISAHEADRSFAWSLRAAEHARARYAWQEQLAHLERALDLWDQVLDPPVAAGADRAELLVRASRAAANVAQPDRAIALVDAALREVDPVRDPDRAARLHVRRARDCEAVRVDPMADLDEALALAAPGSRTRAAALSVRAAVLMLDGAMAEAVTAAQEAVRAADDCGDPAQRSNAHNTLGCLLAQLGRRDEGHAHMALARDIALSMGDGTELFRYYGNHADLLIGEGRFGDAVALSREGLQATRQRGLTRTHGAFMVGNEVEALALAGQWDEALAAADEVMRLAPPPVSRSHVHSIRALLLVRRGDLARAGESVDWACEHLLGLVRQPQHLLPLAVARAELAAAEGDRERGLALLAAAAREAGDQPPAAAGWPFTWAWARMLGSAAAPGEPPGELAAMVAHLGAGSPHPGWVALTQAQLAVLRGQPPDWVAAVEAVAAGEGLLHELADARVRAARQLLDQGQRDAARAQLDAAWATIEALRAASLVPGASQVAARGRWPVPLAGARAAVGTPMLTPREREVLALVAAGRSNRMIADELTISVKTASVHVSNILAKLDVSSRTQAAAWLHSHHDDERGASLP